MAKDDRPVLFCKVLIYLYKVLKGKQERDEYYIQPFTKDFPISEDYLQTVLIELQDFETYKNMSDRIDRYQDTKWNIDTRENISFYR
jgi:hypothetical protein